MTQRRPHRRRAAARRHVKRDSASPACLICFPRFRPFLISLFRAEFIDHVSGKVGQPASACIVDKFRSGVGPKQFFDQRRAPNSADSFLDCSAVIRNILFANRLHSGNSVILGVLFYGQFCRPLSYLTGEIQWQSFQVKKRLQTIKSDESHEIDKQLSRMEDEFAS